MATFDRTQVLQIQAAFQSGYRKCLETYGKTKAFMSLNQCEKRFGKRLTGIWVEEKLLIPERYGRNTSKWYVPVARAEELAVTYCPEKMTEHKLGKK